MRFVRASMPLYSLFDASAEAINASVLAKCVVCSLVASLLWSLLLFTFNKSVLAPCVSVPLLFRSFCVEIFGAWLPIIVEQLLKKYNKTWKFTLYRIFIKFFRSRLPLLLAIFDEIFGKLAFLRPLRLFAQHHQTLHVIYFWPNFYLVLNRLPELFLLWIYDASNVLCWLNSLLYLFVLNILWNGLMPLRIWTMGSQNLYLARLQCWRLINICLKKKRQDRFKYHIELFFFFEKQKQRRKKNLFVFTTRINSKFKLSYWTINHNEFFFFAICSSHSTQNIGLIHGNGYAFPAKTQQTLIIRLIVFVARQANA